jgi:uncharacterized repeat protein (TIGR03847 family)
MSQTFHEVDRFTIGTVGLPGERTFYLQIRRGNQLVSNSIEKMQVSALAERLRFMLKEIRTIHPLLAQPILHRDQLPLDTPIEDEFRVGSIGIFFDESSSMIQIDLRELENRDEEDDIFQIEDEVSDDIDFVRLFITPSQALAFSDRAEIIVSAGRLPCPFCGFPINPDGHLCARANGYRR